MNLTVNSVIEWINNDELAGNVTERVLKIDITHNLIATIEIFSPNSLPIIRSYTQVMGAFNNEILRILEKDPFQLPFVSEEYISENHKKIRDKSWAYISEVIALGFDAFDPRKRGIALAEIAKKYKKTKKDIYKKLRRYWQRGLTKNTLLPAFKNCGSPGKRKLGNSPTDKKLGRKKNLRENNR